MIQLIIKQNGLLVTYAKLDKDLLTIGRSPSNDIVLNAPGVSRVHSKIYKADFCYFFKDLDSANGSHISGSPITSAVPISNGLKIVLDTYTLEFCEVREDRYPDLGVADDKTREIRSEDLLQQERAPSRLSDKTRKAECANALENQKTHLFSRILTLSNSEERGIGRTASHSTAARHPVVGSRNIINRNLQFVVDYSVDNEESSLKIIDATIDDEVYKDEIRETFLDEISVLNDSEPKEKPVPPPNVTTPSYKRKYSNSMPPEDISKSDSVNAPEPSVTEKESPDTFLKLLGLQAERSNDRSQSKKHASESRKSRSSASKTRKTSHGAEVPVAPTANNDDFGSAGAPPSGDHPFGILTPSMAQEDDPEIQRRTRPVSDDDAPLIHSSLNPEEEQPPLEQSPQRDESSVPHEIQVIKIGDSPSLNDNPELPPESQPTPDASEIGQAGTLALESREGNEKTDLYQYSALCGQLHVIEGALAKTAYPLDKEEIWMGRAEDCEIIIPQLNCSRKHAVIRQLGNQYTIIDNNATNGIKVNGAQVSSHPLQNHDVIQVGDAFFEFCEATTEPYRRIPKVVPVEGTSTLLADGKNPPFDIGHLKIALHSKRRTVRLVLFLLICAGALYLLVPKSGKGPTEIFETQAEKILYQRWIDLSKELRLEFAKNGIDVADVKPDILKDETVKRLETSPITKPLIPTLERTYQKDPALFKDLLLHPDKVVPLMKNPNPNGEDLKEAPAAEPPTTPEGTETGKNTREEPIAQGQRESAEPVLKIKRALSEKRYEDAIRDADAALQSNPGNADILLLKDMAIRERKNDEVKGQITDLEKQSDEHRKTAQMLLEKALGYIDKNDLQNAWSSLNEALEFDPENADAQKLKTLIKTKIDDQEKNQGQKKQREEEATILYQHALDQNKLGEVEAAYKTVKLILTKYEDTSVWDTAKDAEMRLRDGLEQKYDGQVQHARASMNEGLYSQAWKTVYAVLSQFPDDKGALEVHKELTDKTELETKKHFIMARVNEVEANDYEAAVQEYDKVITIADPKSDYYSKALRKKQELEKLRVRPEDENF